jgi:hypothetical protein
MRKLTKKTLATVTATALLIAGAGAAFAYWTAGGSGTGSAAVGTSAAITAVQTTTVTPLVPGGAPQTISGTFTNTNTGPVWVSTVTASIASVTKDPGAVAGICDDTDFTLSSAVMAVNASVPPGVSQSAWTGATIAFNNKATNQDQCKLATVTLAYSIG